MEKILSMKKISLKVWQDPVYFIAFGFGSGLLPKFPGTWGTLAAIPIYLLLAPHSFLTYLIISSLLFLLGVWVSQKVADDLNVHDYSGIVWDEVVGYLFTMLCAPHGVIWIIIGFFLFRLFDIWKPYPIGYIDKHVSGGLGIMLDDLIAAIPAALLLQTLAWLFKS